MKAITRFPGLAYPVVPQEEMRNNFGRKTGTTAPLRVKFSTTGVFDSDSPGAREMYAEFARRMSTEDKKFTPEEVKAEVEAYLLMHPENSANGGFRFHIEDAPQQAEEPKAVMTCLAPKIDPDSGESMLCGQPAEPGSDYCRDCDV